MACEDSVHINPTRSAGLSSAELSFRHPGILAKKRSKGITSLGDLNSGNDCGMALVMQHTPDDVIHGRLASQGSQKGIYGEFAGKKATEVNNFLYTHGRRKKTEGANNSSRITQLISGMVGNRMSQNGGIPYTPKINRRMKEFIPSDRLHEAFVAKYQIIDPLTGKTEIMTARKPGKAGAEINVSDFDAYAVRKLREDSCRKFRGNLEQHVLGLTPNAQAKEVTFGRTNQGRYNKQHNRSIECKNNWMAPADDAPVQKLLGDSKRREMLPWLQQLTFHDPIVNVRNIGVQGRDGLVHEMIEESRPFVPYGTTFTEGDAAIQNVPLEEGIRPRTELIAATFMPKRTGAAQNDVPNNKASFNAPSHESIVYEGGPKAAISHGEQ